MALETGKDLGESDGMRGGRGGAHQARIADEQRLQTVGKGDPAVQARVPLRLGYVVGDLHRGWG
jgi:hypothetical protein